MVSWLVVSEGFSPCLAGSKAEWHGEGPGRGELLNTLQPGSRERKTGGPGGLLVVPLVIHLLQPGLTS